MTAMSERATSDADAQFEALRERWEKAKAAGTTLAFAEEMMADAALIAPSPERVYASEEERALYAEVRAKYPFTARDLLNILPCYFGDERGISTEQFLNDLDALESRYAKEGGNEPVEP
jgi:hypothetical protein